MNSKDFEALIDKQIQEELQIMKGKGHDYTAGNDDRLINFKEVGKRAGVSPLQCWLVYFLKHVDSICTRVSTGKQESGEPIEGRIADIRNYALLGLALIKEEE